MEQENLQTEEYRVVGIISSRKVKYHDVDLGWQKAQDLLKDLHDNPNRTVMLCHNRSYRPDPHTIGVMLGGEMIGSINKTQRDRFWACMEGVAKARNIDIDDVRIYAKVLRVNWAEDKKEWFSFDVQPNFGDAEPVPVPTANVWDGWNYGQYALPLSPDDQVRINQANMLHDVISGFYKLTDNEMKEMVTTYLDVCLHDVCGENSKLLNDLSVWLKKQENEELKSLAASCKGMLESIVSVKKVGWRKKWWNELLLGKEGLEMWESYQIEHSLHNHPTKEQLEQCKTELLSALATLRGGAAQYVNHPSDLLCNLFYTNIPRQKLDSVYGMIILYRYICIALKQEKVSFLMEDVEVDIDKSTSPLFAPEAMKLWAIAKDNEWVDENLKLIIEETKGAVLAKRMGDILHLKPFWAPFEQLWEVKRLANKFSKARIWDYYETLWDEMGTKLGSTDI